MTMNDRQSTNLHLLTLSRFPHLQMEQMIARITGDRSFPSEMIQQVVAKTDGVPLFQDVATVLHRVDR